MLIERVLVADDEPLARERVVTMVRRVAPSVAFHYCGKSLQDIAVFGKTKPCCGGMEMPSGCCHDERVEIKSDNFHFHLA